LLFAAKPEQKGKSDMAKPPAPKPTLTPKKPTPTPKKPRPLTVEDLLKDAVERGNRKQAREAEELRRMDMQKKKPMSNYAKGGKIDGVAKKGKTKGKMVKMAMGGLAGRNAMGAMARPHNYGGPARATFKRGGSCGMKKGK
jgi:hypothetical protein